MLSWSGKRQLGIIIAFLVIVIGITAGLLYAFHPAPTCFDKKQNQYEEGVDCGGPCDQPCKNKIVPLRVVWTRIFQTGPGVYDLAALVFNPNTELGAQEINYTARIVDKSNVPIIDQTGQTFVNPGEKFIIYVSGIKTGTRDAGQGFVSFASRIPWIRIKKELPAFTFESQFLEGRIPRLKVTLSNTTLMTPKNISVSAVISDKDGNAFAASATVLDAIDKRSKADVYFTWPKPFGSSTPAIIDIYPRVSIFDVK